MRFSLKGEYGILAALEIALHHDQGPIQVRKIAHQQCIPARFLEQIMSSLKKSGLVESVRGAQGGYRLTKPAENIRLSDLLQAVEGPILPSGRPAAYPSNARGRKGDEDIIKGVWEEVKVSILEVLEGITLQDLCDRKMSLEEKKALMYHI